MLFGDVSRVLQFYFGVTIVFSRGTRKKGCEPPPRCGWCKGAHGAQSQVPAQSGCQGYCKSCFRQRFPEESADKLRKRTRTCGYCGTQKELIAGFCKPCRKSRECANCSQVNINPKAPSCKHCGRLRKQLGADAERLALWCLVCTNEKERSTGYCRFCYDKFAHVVCDNCAQTIGDPLHKHLCPDTSCARVYYLCACCEPRLQLAKVRPQCKACWLRTVTVCVMCGNFGQFHANHFRCCRPCHARWFCGGDRVQSSALWQ